MIKNLLFISLSLLTLPFFAQSFAVTYGFADVTTSTGTLDPSSTPTVTGLQFGAFSAHGTASNPSATSRFSFTGWPLGGVNGSDDYSSFTGALSPTVYYEVTLTPDPGYTLSLNSASFTIRRSGTGIRHYCMRSDQDNYINNLAAATGTNTRLSVIPGDVFFWNYDSVSATSDQRGSEIAFGSAFKSLTGAVRFRLYAWNAESSGGSFGIDNFSFTGSVTDSASTANPLGLASHEGSEPFRIYPCPVTDGKFFMEDPGGIRKVELYGSDGKLLFSEAADPMKEAHAFDLSFLQSGMYFLRVYTSTALIGKKLIFAGK